MCVCMYEFSRTSRFESKFVLRVINGKLHLVFLFVLIPEVLHKRRKWEEEMKAAMAENERELQQIKQTYEEKLRIARQAQKAVSYNFFFSSKFLTNKQKHIFFVFVYIYI